MPGGTRSETGRGLGRRGHAVTGEQAVRIHESRTAHQRLHGNHPRGELAQPVGTPERPLDQTDPAAARRLGIEQLRQHVGHGQVGLERPRRVRVAEDHREVRHVAEHRAFVGHRFADIDALAIDGRSRARTLPRRVSLIPGRAGPRLPQRLAVLLIEGEQGGLGEHRLVQQQGLLPEYRPYDIVRALAEAIADELDFTREAANTLAVRENMQPFKDIVVPRVYMEWTSATVMVQEFVPGVSPIQEAQLHAIEADRPLLARRGALAFLHMVLEDGLFHADPHPGNVFYLTGNRIAFIDFGMTGRLSEERRGELIQFLLGLVQQNPAGVADVLLDWTGDGEVNEGQVWEAAMYAPNRGLNNIIATIDLNRQQIDGPTEQIMDLGSLKDKFEAFGWDVLELKDGNDLSDVYKTLKKAKTHTGKGKPVCVLMTTIMGHGVDFMMHTHAWHGVAPNDEQLEKALGRLAQLVVPPVDDAERPGQAGVRQRDGHRRPGSSSPRAPAAPRSQQRDSDWLPGGWHARQGVGRRRRRCSRT